MGWGARKKQWKNIDIAAWPEKGENISGALRQKRMWNLENPKQVSMASE